MNKLIYRTESSGTVEVETNEVYCFPEDLLEVLSWGTCKIGYNEEERRGSFEDCRHNFVLPKEAPNLHTDVSHMFRRALSFNQSISNFDTSKVTNMGYMFVRAHAFNQSLANWDTSNVYDMSFMFYRAKAFNQSLLHFDTSNVRDMRFMFCDAYAFNQSVSSFDTSNVRDMEYMFLDAKAFQQR